MTVMTPAATTPAAPAAVGTHRLAAPATVGTQRHAAAVAVGAQRQAAPAAVGTHRLAAPATVGTQRTVQAGARGGFAPAPSRVAGPSTAPRETFLEMLWRIFRIVVKHIVGAVGVRR